MSPRRRPRALLALALLAATSLAACSDDDGDDATPTSTSTTSTTTADGLVQVEIEGRPSAVAADLQDLWVASDGEDPGIVRRLDPATGEVRSEIEVGTDPVALAPVEGGVWAIGATGVLSKVEPESTTPTAEVDLGGATVDGVVAAGRLWVADIGRSIVHVLDPETGEVVADPVVVEAGAVRVVAAGERIWVSGLEDQVTPIDVEAVVARQPVTVGQGPIGMAIVQDVLWVANSDDDTVTRISLESGQAVGEPLAVGDAPIALVVDGDSVWVLTQEDGSVLRLDAETGEPIGPPVALPMRPRGMTVAPSGLWVVGVDPSLAVRA